MSPLFRRKLTGRRPRRNPTPYARLCCEALEARDVPTAFAPTYRPLLRPGHTAPLSTAGPTGYAPAQVRHAYGFDQVWFGGAAGDGTGQTIAIVDAYDDPNIATDLHSFDLTFGLPDPAFVKVNQAGGGALPPPSTAWSGEIALDVEWAHAIAPGARLLLVEANNNSNANLFAAAAFAAAQPGVSVVSMSWAGPEWSGETGSDGVFTTPAGHAGVTFVASAGDAGAPILYPAASPNVLAVGGTTLTLGAGNAWAGESAWGGSGGGVSAYEAQPAYQRGVAWQAGTRRAGPDVAYDANPATGFAVCDSYANPAWAPWVQYGGTSAGAPQWSALVAIADQGRARAGLGSLDGPTQTLPALYGLPAGDFHDITTGGSTGTPSYAAGPGYDLATGRGSPVANLVVAGLVSYGAAPVATAWTGLNGSGSAVAVGRNADGSQQAFAVGLDGAVWVNARAAGGSWGGWGSLGGAGSGLVITGNAQGFQDVFVIGSDGAVWMRSETAAGQWAAWTSLGGSCTALAAGTSASGAEQVFAVGAGGALWTRTETWPGVWTAWTSLGGVGRAPVVTRNAAGWLDVFEIGSDGGVWARSETAAGQWAAWTGLGGSCKSIVAGANANGSEQVFAVDAGGALWARTETSPGAWTAWTSLGGIGVAPVVARNAAGWLDVFVVGSDGAVWTRSQTAAGQWTAWTGLGGWARSLAAGTDGWGRLTVVTDAPDGTLASRTQTVAGLW
jgi:hypothetical protein